MQAPYNNVYHIIATIDYKTSKIGQNWFYMDEKNRKMGTALTRLLQLHTGSVPCSKTESTVEMVLTAAVSPALETIKPLHVR